MNSQAVKTTEQGKAVVGFDKHKAVRGRKRFILVDRLGLLVAAAIRAAKVDERSGGGELLSQAHGCSHERSADYWPTQALADQSWRKW